MSRDVACPTCGSQATALFAARDANRAVSHETFSYHRCGSCELIFLSPVPEDLGAYYPEEYYGRLPSLAELTTAAASIEGYKLELVQRFVARGRLLEIGSGLGGFACLAKRAGFDVDVIEMSPACCSFLSEVVGVRAIHTADVAPAVRREGPYDVVALWHAIEHLPDPWEALTAVRERLRPGGAIVIAAPNPHALQFRLLRRWWAHVDAPRHLFLIPLATLTRRAQGLGLSVAFQTTTDAGGLAWNEFGWRQSLSNMTSAKHLRPVASVVGAAVARLAAPLERTNLRGATYTVVLTDETGR